MEAEILCAPFVQAVKQFVSQTTAGSDEKDDIAAQLGVGSAASDAELDRLKDATEAEILAHNNLIGRFAPLVAAFCHQRQAVLMQLQLMLFFLTVTRAGLLILNIPSACR